MILPSLIRAYRKPLTLSSWMTPAFSGTGSMSNSAVASRALLADIQCLQNLGQQFLVAIQTGSQGVYFSRHVLHQIVQAALRDNAACTALQGADVLRGDR